MKNQSIVSTLDRSDEVVSCALCSAKGYLEKIGTNNYCSECSDRIKARVAKGQQTEKSITIGYAELLDLKTSRIISLRSLVYLAFRLEGYINDLASLDIEGFCHRWGVDYEDFLSSVASLSAQGFVQWDTKNVKIDMNAIKSLNLDRKPSDINFSPTVKPLVFTIDGIKSLNSAGLISDRSYVYLFLKINFGVNQFDLEMDKLPFVMGFSKNTLLSHLCALSKRKLISIDLSDFAAKSLSLSERIQVIENNFKG